MLLSGSVIQFYWFLLNSFLSFSDTALIKNDCFVLTTFLHTLCCFPFFKKNFYWSIVDLQFSAVQQSKSVIHIHIHIHIYTLFKILFPYSSLKSIEKSSLCQTFQSFKMIMEKLCVGHIWEQSRILHLFCLLDPPNQSIT